MLMLTQTVGNIGKLSNLGGRNNPSKHYVRKTLVSWQFFMVPNKRNIIRECSATHRHLWYKHLDRNWSCPVPQRLNEIRKPSNLISRSFGKTLFNDISTYFSNFTTTVICFWSWLVRVVWRKALESLTLFTLFTKASPKIANNSYYSPYSLLLHAE